MMTVTTTKKPDNNIQIIAKYCGANFTLSDGVENIQRPVIDKRRLKTRYN